MKPIIKFTAFILLVGSVVFQNCNQEEPVPSVYPSNPIYSPGSPLPPFPPIHDSLSNLEFLYNLVWQTWGDPYVEIEIPDSHLFLNRGIAVSIYSNQTWINLPFYTVEFGLGVLPFPDNNGYVYDNSYFGSVFLFAIVSNNDQLIGTTVSVKIKVL